MPEARDPESLKFTVRATTKEGDKLPPIIRYKKGVLNFNIPDDPTLVNKTFTIRFVLDDMYSKPRERMMSLTIASFESQRKGGVLAELRIVTVTRDQQVTLRIAGPKGSERLLQKMSPTDLNIKIKGKDEEVAYNITAMGQS